MKKIVSIVSLIVMAILLPITVHASGITVTPYSSISLDIHGIYYDAQTVTDITADNAIEGSIYYNGQKMDTVSGFKNGTSLYVSKTYPNTQASFTVSEYTRHFGQGPYDQVYEFWTHDEMVY